MTAPATVLQVWCSECRAYRDFAATGYCATCGTVACHVTKIERGAAPTAVCNSCGGRVLDVEYTCALCEATIDGVPVRQQVHASPQLDLCVDFGLSDDDDEPLSQHIRDKLRILRAAGWHCHYCGRHQGKLTGRGIMLDVDWANYVAACDECLRAIGDRPVQREIDFGDGQGGQTAAA